MKKMLEVNNLSFAYRPNQLILDRVSFTVLRGEVMMLLGMNGCGKTTLIKSVLHLLPASPKAITVDGKTLNHYTSTSLARKIAYVPQHSHPESIDYMVKDYLVLARTPYLRWFESPSDHDYRLVERYAEECGIGHLLETQISHLSGGQFQLVNIAKALVQETDIIVMDEPFSALDLHNQVLVLRLLLKLKNQGKTILLSTHDPNHAYVMDCSVCGFVNGKAKFFGAAKAILTQENIELMYGEGIIVQESGNERFCTLHNVASTKNGLSEISGLYSFSMHRTGNTVRK